MDNKEFTMQIDLEDFLNSAWVHRLLYLYRYRKNYGRQLVSNCLHNPVLENPNFTHSKN